MWIRANGPGIGDAVFVSGVAHEVKKQTGDFVGVACEYGELYDNNPDVDQVVSWRDAPPDSLTFPELHDQGSIKEHNVQFMCRKAGVTPPSWEEVRQYIYLKDTELVNDKGFVTIHAGTGNWTPNKSWHSFEQLVKRIKCPIYQILGPGEEELPGCDRYLRLPLRQVAAYLKNAMLHICCVTGTMHMASGVGTKCVVLFGGRERARITGYYNNINIETEPPQGCSPCWLVEPCPYGTHRHRDGKFLKPCMELMITPEQVEKQVQIALGCEPSSSPSSGRFPLLL